MTTTEGRVRDARAEAALVAGPAYVTSVLEPSPPASHESPWFADDPTEHRGNPALVPHGVEREAATSWHDWALDHPEHANWVRSHWLGARTPLPQPPPTLPETRVALHRLATYVIAPTRHVSTGKFGLRWTQGGFGTPFFDDDRQVRVEGTTLVDQRASDVRAAPITTLQASADFLGASIDAATAAEHDSPPVGDPLGALTIDRAASVFLGEWFGMGFAALEALRSQSATVDPSRPQLWPGHFDPAIEAGDEAHRASYGASPGDGAIDEPYLYVSIWWPDRIGGDPADSFWNAPSFTGAVRRLSDFGPGDPAAAAAEFFATARDMMLG